MGSKRPLTSLTPDELAAFLKERGLPAFRGRQLREWLWKKGVLDYAGMTNLSKELRAQLAAELPVVSLAEKTVLRSRHDGTIKALLATASGAHIEAVAMPEEDDAGAGAGSPESDAGAADGARRKLSVCVSTQVGCAMGCAFCASTAGGLKGSLYHWEIVEQVLLMAKLAGTRATSVVLMGMGEPLANYDNSLEAVRRLNSPDCLGLGARHITVSTVGMVPGMVRMAEEWPHVNLAVSLHAPDEETRRRIIPTAGKWGIIEILEAAGNYARVTGRRYMVEYVLIAGVNASRTHAEELAALLRRRPAKVNLIALNTGGQGQYSAPPEDKVKAFRDVLAERGVEVIIRKRRGRDIEAACGQLRLREES
ncbi:MAG TPA: 23S rRNA (adenine(2503)-C(2))-methyltransferase RlmN [Planctomycetota bacterium]|nr:23S rRNA (adenine(2503)-C(2))-methyltransferase RlmN [Planctomycetota bacterium]